MSNSVTPLLQLGADGVSCRNMAVAFFFYKVMYWQASDHQMTETIKHILLMIVTQLSAHGQNKCNYSSIGLFCEENGLLFSVSFGRGVIC